MYYRWKEGRSGAVHHNNSYLIPARICFLHLLTKTLIMPDLSDTSKGFDHESMKPTSQLYVYSEEVCNEATFDLPMGQFSDDSSVCVTVHKGTECESRSQPQGQQEYMFFNDGSQDFAMSSNSNDACYNNYKCDSSFNPATTFYSILAPSPRGSWLVSISTQNFLAPYQMTQYII